MITYPLLMEAVAAARRTRKPLPAPSVPYPWTKHHTGWWHVSGKSMTFPWNFDNYHITQVFRNPSFFGFTKTSLTDVILAKYPPESGDREQYGEVLWNNYLEGEIDGDPKVEDILYRRGWLRTRNKGGNHQTELSLTGHGDALRKAVGIAMLHIPPTENPAQAVKMHIWVEDMKIGRYQSLWNMELMELYHKGRLVPSQLV